MPLRKRLMTRTDAEWIALRGEDAKRRGKPVYLAHEQRTGWSEPTPLYLWWCADCQAFSVDHPHGYGRLHCSVKPREHRVQVPTWLRFRRTLLPVVEGFPRIFFLVALLFFLAVLLTRLH